MYELNYSVYFYSGFNSQVSNLVTGQSGSVPAVVAVGVGNEGIVASRQELLFFSLSCF